MSQQNKNKNFNESMEKIKEWFKKAKIKMKKSLSKENRLYVYTAVGCATALIAIMVVSLAIAGNKGKVNSQLSNNTPPIQSGTNNGNQNEDKNDEPVITTPEGMITPIVSVANTNDYGFYYNKTLNSYYEHAGVDFMAAVGTNVLAVDDGKVESIYKDDLLSGTEMVINHGDGIRTLYRFIKEVDGLKVGDKVEKGEVIATVAEANGDEYKEGAHLHFEVFKNGKNEDPAKYLTLEEK